MWIRIVCGYLESNQFKFTHVDSNCMWLVANQSDHEELQTKQNKQQIYGRYVESPWYGDIVYFLLHLYCPLGLNKMNVYN